MTAAASPGALDPGDDPAVALAELAGCTTPWLFGVRHHSPACALALPPLLDALAPDVLAVELPADLASWLPWLAHAEAEAPLAVAAVTEAGEELGFYPFADFSPELVALRWARARGVPMHAIDLPASARSGGREQARELVGIAERMRGAAADSWEVMVESPATGQAPEAVRRAALLYGWALRLDAARGGGIELGDRAREAHMRTALAALATGGARVAAIVGSFHAAALLPAPTLWSPPPPSPSPPRGSRSRALVSSLIPYAFELLDARSGYPAGIRDPAWHQRLWRALEGGDATAASGVVAHCLVEITRGIRAQGLPASVPDARAANTMAVALATLRGLAAPGRRELVEAVQTALAQGEVLGRGRVVARAMERVLVGRRRGRLAPGTPRSGLAPHLVALLGELRLPADAALSMDPVELRLDPLRSRLDRRRHVALCRLRACGIPYATAQASIGVGGVETLTVVWRVQWSPATEAMIELAGARGVTLRQAAAGALRAERMRHASAGTLGVMMLIALTESAADSGAGELVSELLGELQTTRLAEATLPELIALVALADRVASGQVVALPGAAADAVPGEIDVVVAPPIDRAALMSAAVATVLGLAGSDAVVDARALAELVRMVERPEPRGEAELGDGRLRWSIDQLAATGAPLIAGAAAVVQVLVGTREAEALATTIGGWLDAATDTASHRVLARRLAGALIVAGPLFEAAPVFLDGLAERVEQLADAAFLARAPALRDGFETLTTAARRRLLQSIATRLEVAQPALEVALAIPPALMMAAAAADRAGRAAAASIPAAPRATAHITAAAEPQRPPAAALDHVISVIDRWRMILGHEREQMRPRSLRAIRALDELYGRGHGEGSRGEPGGGGGDASTPTVREWRDEIEELFGAPIFEEVASHAAARGRAAALLELDPAQITPSVELLEQVLALKGALPEAQLGRLRALVRRVVDDLTRELAVRVRPALHGALSARATRRPTGVLHLARTVAANLGRARVRTGDDGEPVVELVPDRLLFRAKSRRHLDWQVVIVVDVSGSMEPSVIYSAMMAAILSAVPWIAVKFVAFSTEIVDLSDHASDPLALLLEVAVGGGTDIAKGLAYARGLVAVPQRTLVLLVSDFEEGGSVEAMLGEVRALVEAGVTCLGLAALDDRGAPRYAVPIAEQVAAAGMPVAALTPLELARWIGAKLR